MPNIVFGRGSWRGAIQNIQEIARQDAPLTGREIDKLLTAAGFVNDDRFHGVEFNGIRRDGLLLFHVAERPQSTTYYELAREIASFVYNKLGSARVRYQHPGVALIRPSQELPPSETNFTKVAKPPDHNIVWEVAKWAVGSVTAFLIIGIVYYIAAGIFNPFMCIYGDPPCATAFATYLLDALTIGVAATAGIAAYYALRSYRTTREQLDHERTAALGQRVLSQSDLIQSSVDLQLTPKLQFVIGAPQDEHEYEVINFEFISIGRSAITNASVELICEVGAERPLTWQGSLGGIPADGKAIVSVWVANSATESIRLKWREVTTSGDWRFDALGEQRLPILAKCSFDSVGQ